MCPTRTHTLYVSEVILMMLFLSEIIFGGIKEFSGGCVCVCVALGVEFSLLD